jgi:hypothetical protein
MTGTGITDTKFNAGDVLPATASRTDLNPANYTSTMVGGKKSKSKSKKIMNGKKARMQKGCGKPELMEGGDSELVTSLMTEGGKKHKKSVKRVKSKKSVKRFWFF